uniref:Coiled-coil domain-containing protein 22 homolog n=1 Tax=Bursaphelenchus xylophilus TaxID=6326 RepID=A0A1I7RSU0_BURXY
MPSEVFGKKGGLATVPTYINLNPTGSYYQSRTDQLSKNLDKFHVLLSERKKVLEDLENELKDHEQSVQQQTEQAAEELKKSRKLLRKAVKADKHIKSVDDSVEKGIKKMDSLIRLITSFEVTDEASLDELERALVEAENQVEALNINNIFKAEQNKILEKQRQNLRADIERLTRDLSHLRIIQDTLPFKCFNHVKIEQQ